MPEFKRYPGEDPIAAEIRIAKNVKGEALPTSDASMRSESYQMGGLVGGRPRMGGGLGRQRSPIAPTDFPPINVPFGPSYKKGGKVKK